MSGVTLSDLSKYHQGAMKWFKDGLVSEHNRLFAQTGEAGAVSFWPLGGTPLEGKVKFSFKETPPASGDKGPENPSTISGASNIYVMQASKNLFWIPAQTQVVRGVTITIDSNNVITMNGTCTSAEGSTAGIRQAPASTYNVETGKYVNMKVILLGGTVTTNNQSESRLWGFQQSLFNKNNDTVNKYANITNNTVNGVYSSLISVDSRLTNQYVYAMGGVTYSNFKFKLEVEISDSIADYESPNIVQTVIPLGSTYYGGEIDLATGVMTVTHKKVRGVVGSTIQLSGDFVRATLATSEAVKKDDSQLLCNMLPTSTDTAIERVNTRGSDEFWSINCYINKSRLDLSGAVDSSNPTTAELKSAITAWLANNQLEFVYKRTNPTTVQLTPLQLTALAQKDKYTPRMNTVYTDADSIQIRYRKSLIHDEDEKVQAIVALGGNV